MLRQLAFLLALALTACGPAGGGSNNGFKLPDLLPEPTVTDDAGMYVNDTDAGCGLRTCASAGWNCGPIGDGCGGLIQCGQCTPPETCGGGGQPSVCGGMASCVKRTCAQEKATCGPVADGCGGLLDCGKCMAGTSCGGGGVPNACGSGGPPPPDGGVHNCTPKTCADYGFTCGPAGDGCGAMLDCGTCAAGQGCGVGGKPSVCGALSLCMPLTCKAQNFDCGMAGDGCGGVVSCGSCGAGNICGGGGVPNVCGSSVPPKQCTNLCKQQMDCGAGVSTTVSGTVYAPTNPSLGYGNPDPLYGALVYVPNAPVANFTGSVQCSKCSDDVSGSPLVSATTGPDGKFVLTNSPCGNNIPIVIQLGRWRRQITVNVACCTNTQLTPDQSRLPRNHTEGDIPQIAIITGGADPIECVLPKIGIDASEFTNGGGGGRVQMYWSDASYQIKKGDYSSAGAIIDNNTPPGSSLWKNPGTLATNDAVILDCEGLPFQAAKTAYEPNFVNYTTAGGRLFASHYSYSWLYNIAPFSSTAAWQPQQTWNSPFANPNNGFPYDNQGFTAVVDTSFQKGKDFSSWLGIVGASKSPGTLPVYAVRHDFNAVNSPAQRWFYDDPNDFLAAPWTGIPLEFTFNTPVGGAQQCGRVLFSDFHVNTGGGQSAYFPDECGPPSPMTSQEKVLEFMLFDLTSCIQPDNTPPPTCTARSCAQQNAMCGAVGDGCGNIIQCGPCPQGQVCGGGGKPNQCGAAMCTMTTCAAQGFNCGPAGDGCGGSLSCGSCPKGQSCGGGGKPGVCGSADAGACVPLSCADQKLGCGPAGDGCGAMISCGTCPAGQSCGGGGVPGQCGAPMCKKQTCAGVKANCGLIGDGCGGTVDCGTCPANQTCGGGGTPNQCSQIG